MESDKSILFLFQGTGYLSASPFKFTEGESPARSEAAVLAGCQKRQGRHPKRCRGLGCHNLCAHPDENVYSIDCVQAQLDIIMQAMPLSGINAQHIVQSIDC